MNDEVEIYDKALKNELISGQGYAIVQDLLKAPNNYCELKSLLRVVSSRDEVIVNSFFKSLEKLLDRPRQEYLYELPQKAYFLFHFTDFMMKYFSLVIVFNICNSTF